MTKAPEGSGTGDKSKVSPRMRIVGAAAVAVLLALGIKAVASPHKARADGLPPPITSQVDAIPAIPPPEAGAEPAELDELVKIEGQRTEAQAQEAQYWERGAVLQWNEIARGLVVKYGTNPLNASRAFALLSVAQHDALLAVLKAQREIKRPAPARVKPLFAVQAESTYPSEHAAVAAASAAVLGFIFNAQEQREELVRRATRHEDSRMWAGVSRRSDIVAGDTLGKEVAEKVIALAKTDAAAGAGVDWRGVIPKGKDKWFSLEHPPVVPTRPLWGQVRPWLMKSGDQFRSPPPPDVDSPEFAKAIAEVKRFSVMRTPEQLKIALFWGDAPGTPTPPGHWNEMAADIITKQRASAPRTDMLAELSAARTLTFLNMAMMDAGIACWDTKFFYWYLRPSQADPTITLPVGLPNFPSYPSGHSSFSGAAAEVLDYFFPSEKAQLDAKADEASMSRVYGGIHYRFDGEQGLAMGRSVGKLAVEKAKSEPSI